MNSQLARALVDRGVIRQGTVIDSDQEVRGLSCDLTRIVVSFVIVKACLHAGVDVVFEAVGPDRRVRRIRSEAVCKLDGMMIERVAISQNLSMDGVELARRSQRGRKKKFLVERVPCD